MSNKAVFLVFAFALLCASILLYSHREPLAALLSHQASEQDVTVEQKVELPTGDPIDVGPDLPRQFVLTDYREEPPPKSKFQQVKEEAGELKHKIATNIQTAKARLAAVPNWVKLGVKVLLGLFILGLLALAVVLAARQWIAWKELEASKPPGRERSEWMFPEPKSVPQAAVDTAFNVFYMSRWVVFLVVAGILSFSAAYYWGKIMKVFSNGWHFALAQILSYRWRAAALVVVVAALFGLLFVPMPQE